MIKPKKPLTIEQFSAQSRGIYDALPNSAAAEFDEKIEEEEGGSEPEPIDPSPQMAVQLSVAEPPVTDEEFVPGSLEELANAASVLSREIPPEEIKWYYKQLHKLVDEANSRTSTGTPESEEQEDSVQEESVRRAVRSALYEVLSAEEESELDKYRTGALDYFGETEPPPEEPPEEPPEDEGMSLEDLAQEFGYSGPSGVRQEIARITNKLGYFAQKVKKDDLEALLSFAAGEYVDVLGAAEVLDAEDLEDLHAAPQAVRELDSFRFFFVSSFVLPAYKEVAKEASRELEARVQDLGLPASINLTVMNQLTGKAKSDPGVIRRKLQSLISRGDIAQEEAKAVEKKIQNSMPALKQAAELSDDLVEKALDKWQSVSKKKKLQLLKKAMDQTAEL